MSRVDPPRDFADDLVASWAESRPEFDVTPVAITTRLARLRDHFEGEIAAVIGSYGLTTPTFVMLATLARLHGAASEARLAEELGLTAGTIGVRIDRLATDGLVRRDDDVTLTDRGQEIVDAAVPAHLENLGRLLAPLGADEQATLAALLRTLLASFEG